jgi:hypothetical protein
LISTFLIHNCIKWQNTSTCSLIENLSL